MARIAIQEILAWVSSLAPEKYPEDRLYFGSPDFETRGVLLCWFANAGARKAAQDAQSNLIVTHETPYYETLNRDPGCPPPEVWQVNQKIVDFYRATGIAVIRSHRALDAYGLPQFLAEHLEFPPPTIQSGYNGYNFTLVYDLLPQSFGKLASDLQKKMGLPFMRTSACNAAKPVRRVGMGWGGVSLSSNLQYMELLRNHGVEVVIGGEIDEYALEYYRESDMEWIELGHYATEIIGLEKVATDMADRFHGMPVRCYRDVVRMKCCVSNSLVS